MPTGIFTASNSFLALDQTVEDPAYNWLMNPYAKEWAGLEVLESSVAANYAFEEYQPFTLAGEVVPVSDA